MRRSPSSLLVGGLRRVARALASPRDPGDYLDMFSPLRPGAALRGRITSIVREPTGAVTVTIRPGKDWAGHRPGQYVRVGIQVDGVRQWRAYSITSPGAERTLTITVKPVEGGVVSNHLGTRARVGELVSLEQAAGEFVLPDAVPPKLLFVAAGSGITPIMGMLRGHADALTDVVMIHSSASERAALFGPELRVLGEDPRVRLIERHTDTQERLGFDELDELVPDWTDRQAWVCGPAAMLDEAEEHWAEAGIEDRLHIERFRPVILSDPEDGGEVTFRVSGRTVDAPGDRPLLDVGEESHVLMPSGCRMGICFGCVGSLAEGTVRHLRTGELIEATEDPVHIQTCITAAAGRCVIDL